LCQKRRKTKDSCSIEGVTMLETWCHSYMLWALLGLQWNRSTQWPDSSFVPLALNTIMVILVWSAFLSCFMIWYSGTTSESHSLFSNTICTSKIFILYVTACPRKSARSVPWVP
jgi:hypothetical protein